jgi:hypothetical protein
MVPRIISAWVSASFHAGCARKAADSRAKFAFSIVIPLITTVGINNKVTVLEKYGTGYASFLT